MPSSVVRQVGVEEGDPARGVGPVISVGWGLTIRRWVGNAAVGRGVVSEAGGWLGSQGAPGPLERGAAQALSIPSWQLPPKALGTSSHLDPSLLHHQTWHSASLRAPADMHVSQADLCHLHKLPLTYSVFVSLRGSNSFLLVAWHPACIFFVPTTLNFSLDLILTG